jgi:uncharacterized membrane protein YjjP (DUF1212 family)
MEERYTADDVLELAADSGQLILENGGETYRVEETMITIGKAFGMAEVGSFATPTGIIASVTGKDGRTAAQVRRVRKRTINIEVITQLNDLSHQLAAGRVGFKQMKAEVERIARLPIVRPLPALLWGGVSAGFFTLLFGGGVQDALVSFFIGCIIKLLMMAIPTQKVGGFFMNILGGGLAALLALISVHIGLGMNLDKIIIGSIMLLVPGLIMVNAIRDTIAGDLVAGVSRGVEAIIVAVAISIGTGIVLKIWFLLLGRI